MLKKALYFFQLTLLTGSVGLMISCGGNNQEGTPAEGKAGNSTANPAPTPAPIDSGSEAIVLFLNKDSLLTNYQLVIDLRAQLETEEGKLQSTFDAEVAKFQKAYKAAEENFQKYTQKEIQDISLKLQKQEQDLANLERQFVQASDELQLKMTQKIWKETTEFLERYKNKRNCRMILPVGTSSGDIFYYDKQYDITKEVIDAMNIEYASNKDAILSTE